MSLLDLPSDLLREFMKRYFHPKDALTCLQVCKRLNEIVDKHLVFDRYLKYKTYPYIGNENSQVLKDEFERSYMTNSESIAVWNENGIGVEDLKRYPSTETHRKMFPEDYNFIFNDHKCYIRRVGGIGVWCGYVFLNEDDPKVDYESQDLYVHGGITCSDKKIIGFDCGHFDDLRPTSSGNKLHSTYKVRAYVISELKRLASQLPVNLV